MNFKRCFLFLICFAFFFSCNKNKTQDTQCQVNHDSIRNYLNIAKNDILPFGKRDLYNRKAFELIDLNQNDTLTRYYLNETCYNYSTIENWKLFDKTIKIFKKKVDDANDTLGLARYCRLIGWKYTFNKKYDSAFYFYLKAEKFYKKTNDKWGLYKVLRNKASIQQKLDDYLGAEVTCLKALKYLKDEKNFKEFIMASTNYANILADLGHYDSAIKKYKEVLNIVKEKKLKVEYDFSFTCLNNIGTCYKDKKDYKNALIYFNYVLNNATNLEKHNLSLYGFLHNNIGFCNLKLKRYKNVEMYFNKAANFLEMSGQKKECILNDVYLSNYYLETKDTISAIKFSEKALKLSKEIVAPNYLLIALSNAGMINKAKASKYIVNYHRISDSLIFQERKARNQYYKIQLETDDIKQQKDTAIKQTTAVIIITSTIVLLLLLLFVIFRQKAKQKELKLLQAQQQANEEIYQLMLSQNQKEEEARKEIKTQIALELHDSVMNKLASTRLNLFVLSKKNDEETIKNCLKHIDGIQEIENEIRNVSHNLHNEAFIEKDSFNSLLYSFINDENTKEKIKFELQVEHQINWDSIGNNIKMNLFRIIQEAVSNCYKHSKATNVIICFILDQNNLCLSISDNGIGIKNQENTSSGIGIKNMKTRVKELGGVFSIHSSPNSGTAIHLAIPIK